MSKQADRLLTESMGRRRPREVVKQEVAESILGELLPSGTIDVQIECLVRSPYQVRSMGSEEEIDRLAESIQSTGLISPVVIRPIADPSPDLQVKFDVGEGIRSLDSGERYYEIVAGHHRVQAALKLGWKSIPALIKSMTDAQAAIALTSDNAIKKDLTDWDRYQSILMLERTGACKTGREIAATLGVSPAQISQIRAFAHLPDRAIEIINQNPSCCSYKLAYEVVSKGFVNDHPDLVIDAINHLSCGKIKAQNQVVPWIKTQLSARKPAGFRRELRIQRDGHPKVRIVVTRQGATIDAQGIDPEKLALVLENNLDQIIS